ncbi:hypothetical protein SBRCBS47491_004857 [Sporothrix bragantina]|uniref:Transcription elongation factor 1 homolog n=1 Tax=Sporothrix bragantina TaxID=671064 RepID=A0ABP0BRW0_9PEZI
MGKRKSSSKPQGPKKADPLPTTFSCLFCNHEKSVAVKLDKKLGIGYLECKVCGQKFQCEINYLSAAVDVYGEWVDAADAVAQEKVENENSRGRLDSDRYSSGRAGASSRDLDEDDDGGNRRYADDEDDY